MNSEEQYKHIEQKIVEAANQNEYPFTEEAWKRMELLLNKKDKKRRFFFWLFPLLLVLSVGGGIAIYNTIETKNSTAAIQKEEIKSSSIATPQSIPPNETASKLEVVKDANTISVDKNDIENVTSKTQAEQALPQKQQPNFLVEQTDDNRSKSTLSNKSTSQKKSKSKKQKSNYSNEEELYVKNKTNLNTNKKAKVKITSPAMNEDEEDPTVINEEKWVNKKSNEMEEKEVIDVKPSTTEVNKKQEGQEIKKEQTPNKPNENKKEEENKSKKKQPQFFITASLGAEANTTKLLSFTNTKIVPRYGAAIGYQFNNKLSVQAGFYVSGKKYIAKKEDYNFKSNSYLANLDITKIDANCKVYEIPLSIQYNFITKPSLNVFSTVGVSSYIMKKEDYVYDYWYGGVFYSTPWTYTKNTHLLAAATFSLGLEKPVSKKIVLQLAPRISIPLSGVGDGSVKLFSSGIDFGVKYYPFKK
jgi:hypothetical protein